MENKGITLITVIVMISVILILSAIFLSTGMESLEESKKAEKENEIHQIKLAVVDRYTSYEKNDGSVSLIGTSAKNKWATSSECVNSIIPTLDFSSLSSDDKESKINRITSDITRDYDEFVMLINSGDMARLGVDKASDSLYVVDYYTGSVYGPIEE